MQAVKDALEPAGQGDGDDNTTVGSWAELLWSITSTPGTAVAAHAAQALPWNDIIPLLSGGPVKCHGLWIGCYASIQACVGAPWRIDWPNSMCMAVPHFVLFLLLPVLIQHW